MKATVAEGNPVVGNPRPVGVEEEYDVPGLDLVRA
jgi:hypothetical protein